ncbi:adapter protein MecA 1/2 [Eubacterium ruminantium]|uniref:Adapter protein MecA 1/2 n=1 Tax=Eubacterium ruminantium TaxID=42322 RepID=A0A1T4N7N2_9FIRM|nr:adaptor protein MecA [Eubacterium ruminantium]SCW52160.1 adapter protein MecA 1/2 [Eubacterium ruminantium]SDM64379.1 adapter protein MecA 1/2 [Eubacterium ruminantium]SJZ75211.1 adapter protein MecA 1/2 [Eubacterium ruminantium]
MKIEKINDNQIRCILNREDLAEKNIRLAELAYGTDKARQLFQEMIKQASEELDFEIDESPLMIEAIPTNKDTLILIVTKVDNPDELDSRFSRFTHLSQGDDLDDLEDTDLSSDDQILSSDDEDGIQNNNDKLDNLQQSMKEKFSDIISGITSALGNIAENVVKNDSVSFDTPDAHVKADVTITASPGNKNRPPAESPYNVYMFKDLSSVIAAANEISSLYFSDNTLYKDENSGFYFLYATSNANTATSFEEVEKKLLKYSLKCRTTYASISFYNEHFKIIRRKNAMQLMATI